MDFIQERPARWQGRARSRRQTAGASPPTEDIITSTDLLYLTMQITVYVFFPGTKSSKSPRDIESWEMFHWPAVVVETLFPQAVWHRTTSGPARYLRERLAAAIDLVEAAVQSEETETAMDDAEALSWQLRDLVLQCEAHEHLTGQETLIRTQG